MDDAARYTIEDQGDQGFAVFDNAVGQIIAKGLPSYEFAEDFIKGGPESKCSSNPGSTLLDI